MKKTILIFLSVLMLISLFIGLAITSGAEEQDSGLIPVPEIPAINRPYKTIEELGVDFETLESYFPESIEIRQEGSKVYIEDIGAGSTQVYTTEIYDLELVDGYWTGDIEGELRFIYYYSYGGYTANKYWNVVYYADGTRDPYIVLNDNAKGVYISFSHQYGYASVLYSSGDYSYEDAYTDGVLDTHGVENDNDTESVEVYYDVNGEVSYCEIYTDTYYYYYPNQGWSSSWYSFIPCEAPAGYEDIDETYFTANKPPLICSEANGDDILHDMPTAYCTSLATCKNGCGYTEGEIEHHTWQTVGGEKVCSECDAVFFPEFEYVDRIYPTVTETGFPYDEYRALFPDVLTVKYENGKYMIKDVGADMAEACTSMDSYVDISLVDGWWIYELDEEVYNDESIDIFVTFRGELNGGPWNVNYCNGQINGSIYIESENTTPSVRVYYASYDWVCFMYYVGGRRYTDSYADGVFSSQEVITRYGDDELNVDYNADGTVESILINIDGNWFYYYPDRGWENGSGEPIDSPEGYENTDVEFLMSVAPTTINCAHEGYSEADCLNPELCLLCGIPKEGSQPLGHDTVIDERIEPTCTEIGYTEGSHCSKCGEITIEQKIIDELGHTEQTVAGRAPTCTETGLTDGTQCSVCDEVLTAQTEIAALGHAYDNACDATCNTCGEERTPAEHYSENADGKCDECGESFELSGGAIAGIAVGSTAVAGTGGFSLFWFVIKKKRWSDLVGLFRK